MSNANYDRNYLFWHKRFFSSENIDRKKRKSLEKRFKKITGFWKAAHVKIMSTEWAKIEIKIIL